MILEEIIEKRFSFIHSGHSFRCTELEAAIGVGQLARAEEIIARRRKIAAYFTSELSPYAEVLQLPSCPADRTHSFMMYGLVLRHQGKKQLVNFLEHANVETRDMLPLTNQPIYQSCLERTGGPLSCSEMDQWSGFYIGCHTYMSDRK